MSGRPEWARRRCNRSRADLLSSSRMRVVVTGGAGFIGRGVVRLLTECGDDVVAVVRDPASTTTIAPPVTLVAGDLRDTGALQRAMSAADAVILLAGMYRVGIPPSERPAMLDANVGATERVIDAAVAAGVRRIIYVSTVNIFGNTNGRVVDETYQRDVAG